MIALQTLVLDDDVIFLRTAAGQNALVSSTRVLSKLERRFLGAVSGLTPLRVLIDLGFDERGIGDAVRHLVALRMIRIVDPLAK